MIIFFIFLIGLFFFWYLFFSRRDKSIEVINFPKFTSISLALIIVAYNIFIYQTYSHLSFPLLGFAGMNIAFVIALLISFNKEKINPLTLTLSGLSILSSALLVYRANGFVQSFNVFVSYSTVLLLLLILFYQKINWSGLWLFQHILKIIPKGFKQILAVIKQTQLRKKNKFNLVTLIKTAAITLVVVVVFAGLLSNADPVFSEIIKDFREQIFARTFVSIIIAFLFMVLVSLRIKKTENRWELKFFSFYDLFIPIIALVSLFAVFLIIQIKYLYDSHDALQSFDLTYSEYVRKGFVELLIAALAGGIISYIVILKKELVESISKVRQLKAVTLLLITELFFVLLSAAKRNGMYMEAYGLTRVRIIGTIFLVWLATLLILLLLRVLVKKMTDKHFFLGMLVASIGVWIGLNIPNIDQIVVSAKPAHHDYKDYFYINNLSPDGINGWKESLPAIEESLNRLLVKSELTEIEKSELTGHKLALISIKEKREFLFLKYAPEKYVKENCKELACSYNISRYNRSSDKTTDIEADEIEFSNSVKNMRKIQHFNFSEKQAFDLLYQNQEKYIDKVDELINNIKSFQSLNNISLYEQEYRLLREFKYPFININLNYYPQKPHVKYTPVNINQAFD